ncbi:MAG: hypothetical protein GY835_17745 [bacterium]|nr:hypothetical protein [bacterium]
MRKAMIGMLLVLLVTSVSAIAQEEYTFNKGGYSYFIGNTMGAVGLLEILQPENPPIIFDYDTYQVTWAIEDMNISTFNENGPIQAWLLEGGSIGIYFEAEEDFEYGTDPATGLATGTDGNAALLGTVIDASFLFNTISNTGTFLANILWTGGDNINDVPELTEVFWAVFDGASASASVNVPENYHSRFAGRIYNTDTVPTEASTISKIKALY